MLLECSCLGFDALRGCFLRRFLHPFDSYCFSFSDVTLSSFALLFDLKAFCALDVLLLESSFVELDSVCVLVESDLEGFRAFGGLVSVLSVCDFLFSNSDC